MKVTLAKALKTKNRITSRITQLKKQILAYNSYMVDKNCMDAQPEIDVSNLVLELDNLTKKLIYVKAAISKGNSGSAVKIFELSETKGLIAYWESLDCSTNNSDPYGRFRGNEATETKRVQISLPKKNAIVLELTAKSAQLQDELDEYNATHRVDIPDDIL